MKYVEIIGGALIVAFLALMFYIAFMIAMTSPIYPSEIDWNELKNDIPVNTILLEARGEGYKGMLAVADVIRQRVDDRGLTEDGVCMQNNGLFSAQFSCYRRGFREAEVSFEIRELAKKAWIESATHYKTFGANLYCRHDCWPKWRTSPNVKFIKRIGNHAFYKEARNGK